LLCHCFHQGLAAVSCHIFEANYTTFWDAHCARGSFASPSGRIVWITVFSAQGVFLCVAKSIIHKPPLASMVGFVAINKLLL
jgi:hypothetical protein